MSGDVEIQCSVELYAMRQSKYAMSSVLESEVQVGIFICVDCMPSDFVTCVCIDFIFSHLANYMYYLNIQMYTACRISSAKIHDNTASHYQLTQRTCRYYNAVYESLQIGCKSQANMQLHHSYAWRQLFYFTTCSFPLCTS